MNKRGTILNMIIFVVLAFVITLFIGVWLYGHNLITNTVVSVGGTVGNDTSINETFSSIFTPVNNAYQDVGPLIAFAFIFGMILTILINSFLVRVHPVFFILYVMFLVLAVILAVVVSNSYQDVVAADPDIGAQLQAMVATNFVLSNLPIWVAVIGFIGIIILMAGIPRDRELGGFV